MTPGAFLKLYLLTIPVFLVLDAIWLGVVAKGFYRQHIGHLMADDVRWGAAALFYLLFIAGLLFFATLPALDRPTPWRAVLFGGLFGLITYATYDLTNLATMRGFPVLVAAADMAWGFALGAMTSGAAWRLAALVR